MRDGDLNPDPDADADADLSDLRKDLTASVAWAFQALLAGAAFCAVTAASHPDADLLTGAKGPEDVEVPVLGLKVAFLFWFVVGPPVLIAMQAYLHIQACALMRLPHGEKSTGLLSNHATWWPFSLLGFVCYAVTPGTTAFLLWKVWPRRYLDDPLPWFDGGRMGLLTVLSAIYLASACALSLASALADWRCLRAAPRRRPPRGWRLWAGVAATALPLAAVLGVALPRRHLELSNAHLEGADLRHLDLRRGDLRQAKLVGASMGGAMLADADLASAALDHADLRGADLSRADLYDARLNGADLTGACLIATTMTHVETEGARFRYAWMAGAVLEPQPRTRLDRVPDPAPADAAYEALGEIDGADFEQARLCAAQVLPATWRKDVPIGEALHAEGHAWFASKLAADGRWMPPGFGAQPFPMGPEPAPDVRSAFVRERLAACFEAMRKTDFAARCPEGARTRPDQAP